MYGWHVTTVSSLFHLGFLVTEGVTSMEPQAITFICPKLVDAFFYASVIEWYMYACTCIVNVCSSTMLCIHVRVCIVWVYIMLCVVVCVLYCTRSGHTICVGMI